ncbi:MAG TPA: DUF1775 domain-containing protein [Actinoplanes sp.]|nr:DUF1775 domain-containing protein [Actinoplanes sp.]
MTVLALVGIAVAVAATPAFAHVQVSADKTQAGATDVTLTFDGEAENPKAGIKSERVVLPTGIAPADVSLVKAPSGWTFTRNADGFTVGGKALSTGTDARWSVKVAKLPADQTRLSFKTLETYGDGEVSRWIEIQEPGQPEPDNPAPLLVLKPAAAAAPASPSAAPATLAPSADASGPAVDAASAHPAQPLWWLWPAGIALIVGGAAWVYSRRRAERQARDRAPR